MTTEIKQLELLFDRPAAPEPDRSRFFCITHQSERPLSEQSADPRYCRECFGVIKGSETQSYPAVKWSKCGLVEFLDGRSYTVDRKGHTVDIGREVDVIGSFKTGKVADNLCPDRKTVLKQILKVREEIVDRENRAARGRNGGDTSRNVKASDKRSRSMRRPGRRPAGIRRAKGKRFASNPVKRKGKSLFGARSR
jgi:hypothetical protein